MNVSDVIEKNNKITKILAENLIEKLNTDFVSTKESFMLNLSYFLRYI